MPQQTEDPMDVDLPNLPQLPIEGDSTQTWVYLNGLWTQTTTTPINLVVPPLQELIPDSHEYDDMPALVDAHEYDDMPALVDAQLNSSQNIDPLWDRSTWDRIIPITYESMFTTSNDNPFR